MAFHPGEAPVVRQPLPTRVKRARQRRRRFAAVATLAAVLVVGGAVKAFAWTLAISGQGICNEQTGDYDLTWTLDNTSEPEAASVTGDLSATVPANGTTTVSESVPGSTSGSVSRSITVNWPSDQANLQRTGTIDGLTGDCEKPAPPTTNPPVTDEPPTKEEPPLTPDEPKLGPPDRHPAPPVEEAPPTVTETPGELPFTGPREDIQRLSLVVGLASLALGAALVLATRQREAQLDLVERAVDRAMHGKPYQGPRERL